MYFLLIFSFVGLHDRLQRVDLPKAGLALCYVESLPTESVGELCRLHCGNQTIPEAVKGCERLCHTRYHEMQILRVPSVPD